MENKLVLIPREFLYLRTKFTAVGTQALDFPPDQNRKKRPAAGRSISNFGIKCQSRSWDGFIPGVVILSVFYQNALKS